MKSHIEAYNSLVERLDNNELISQQETNTPVLLREWAYDNWDYSILSDDP